MKTFLKICLVLILVFLTPLLVFVSALKFTPLTADTIKTQLREQNIYEKITDTMILALDDSSDKSIEQDPILLLAPFLKKEITAAYIHSKVDKLIDDTNLWVAGKTKNEPIISFGDLKEKLITQNAPMVQQLEEMMEEIKKQKPEIEKAMKEQGESQQVKNLEALSQFNIADILKKDFTIPVGKYLFWIKILSVLSTTGFVILLGTFCVGIVAVYLLNDTAIGGLRWLGFLFVLSSLSLVLPWITGKGFSVLLYEIATQNDSIPKVLVPLSDVLLKPLINSFIHLTTATLPSLFIAGISAFVMSFVYKTSDPPKMTKISIPSSKQNLVDIKKREKYNSKQKSLSDK